MSELEAKLKWLEQTGYEYIPHADHYRFTTYFPNEKYGASNSFMMWEVQEAKLIHMIMLHNHFCNRVERREEF